MAEKTVGWFIVREKYCSLTKKIRLISQANKAIVCFPLYELDALQIFPQSQTQWGGGLCWLTAERNKHWCLDPKIIPAYCSLLHVILPVSCCAAKVVDTKSLGEVQSSQDDCQNRVFQPYLFPHKAPEACHNQHIQSACANFYMSRMPTPPPSLVCNTYLVP